MEVSNELYPVGEDQTKAMLEAGPDGPIVMVNLPKLNIETTYSQAMTGATAQDPEAP